MEYFDLENKLEKLVTAKEQEILMQNKITSLGDLLDNTSALYKLNCAHEAHSLIVDLYEMEIEEFDLKVREYGLEQIFDKFSNPVYSCYLAIYGNREFDDEWYCELVNTMDNDHFRPVVGNVINLVGIDRDDNSVYHVKIFDYDGLVKCLNTWDIQEEISTEWLLTLDPTDVDVLVIGGIHQWNERNPQNAFTDYAIDLLGVLEDE